MNTQITEQVSNFRKKNYTYYNSSDTCTVDGITQKLFHCVCHCDSCNFSQSRGVLSNSCAVFNFSLEIVHLLHAITVTK